MKSTNDVVENFLAVQSNHRLQAVFSHHIDSPTARYRHPDLDWQMFRSWYHRNFLKLIPAIRDRWRAFVKFTLVIEGFIVKAFNKNLKLFLEQLTIGLGIQERRPKGLDFARVIPAANSHYDTAIGDDVRHSIVLGQPDRVPHRENIECATEF